MCCQKLVSVSKCLWEWETCSYPVMEKVILEIIQVVVMAYRQNPSFTESFYYNEKLEWKK